MPDYKKMYLTLFRATEQAINTLIAAQQECEELYMEAPQRELIVLPQNQDIWKPLLSVCRSRKPMSRLREKQNRMITVLNMAF